MRHKVVHYSDSASFGGTEQALLHLLAGLDRDRWEPVLIHHGGGGIAPLLAGAADSQVRLRAVQPMHRVRGVGLIPSFAGVIRAERPTIFHAHLTWPLACKFGLVAARLARVPHVVATAQLFMNPRPTVFAAVQHRIVTAAVDRFIAVSDEVAKQLHRRLRVPLERVRVVRNAIATAPFDETVETAGRSPWNARSRATVLTVARLDPQKGLDYLVHAAAQVPDALFLVAGEGPLGSTLEAEVRSLGLSDRFKLLGFRSDIPDLLRTCDLFVLPSLYEGLPLSVLEAMAAGKPVIASDIGGTDEAVVHGETGLLVPPADPSALARAIRELLADPVRARRFGSCGRARVAREFSADLMVERVSAVYSELLADSSGKTHG